MSIGKSDVLSRQLDHSAGVRIENDGLGSYFILFYFILFYFILFAFILFFFYFLLSYRK